MNEAIKKIIEGLSIKALELREGTADTITVSAEALLEALTQAHAAGVEEVKPVEKSSTESRRMRELAGIPHRENYTK